jgi:hypothetical protein
MARSVCPISNRFFLKGLREGTPAPINIRPLDVFFKWLMRPNVSRLIPNTSHLIIYSPSSIVQLLLDKDTDIWKEGLYGTALGAAVFASHKAVTEQLLDHGANKTRRQSWEECSALGTVFPFRTTEGIHLLFHVRYAGSFRLRIGSRAQTARDCIDSCPYLCTDRFTVDRLTV